MYNMPLLMEKEITTNRIILTNYEIFRALDDPIRGKIVQLLHKKQLNVEQICRRLKKFDDARSSGEEPTAPSIPSGLVSKMTQRYGTAYESMTGNTL